MNKITIEVCSGSECTMMGAMDIVDSIESLKKIKTMLGYDSKIEIIECKCLGGCKEGKKPPIVKIDGEVITNAKSETVMEKILSKMHKKTEK